MPDDDGNKRFSYKGPSMNPTLRTPDGLLVVPYNGNSIKRGYVVVFNDDSRGGMCITHRVVSIGPQGIRTQVDNNRFEDKRTLGPKDVLGKVVEAERFWKNRRIYGGTVGWLIDRIIRNRKKIDAVMSSLLHPYYHKLARSGFFRHRLSVRFKQRILCYRRGQCIELQLLLGKYVVGRHISCRYGWQIKRPFKIFVDDGSLPTPAIVLGNEKKG